MYRIDSKFAKGLYLRSIIIIILFLLSNVSLMLYTVCISDTVNNVIKKDNSILTESLLLLIFYFCMMLTVNALIIKAKRHAEYQSTYELRSEFLEHLYSIPMCKLDEFGRNNIANRYQEELEKIISFYINAFPEIVRNCTLFVFISVYVFNENMLLFFIMLFAVPVVCLSVKRINLEIGALSSKLTELDVNRNSLEYDTLASKVELKCFCARDFILGKAEEAEEIFRKTGYKKASRFTFIWGMEIFAFIAISNIILAVGGGMAMKGYVTFGAITSLIVIMDHIVSSVFSFSGIYAKCMEIRPYIERYNKWQNIEREKNLPESVDYEEQEDLIYELKNVAYQYNNINVFQNIALNIKRGKKYLFVGKSGIGKSTLLKILVGYDNKYKGSVCFKGRELSEWDSLSLRKQLIYAPEDMFFVSGSVRELFTLIYPEISDSEIQFWTEALELPFSSEFYVEKGGLNISGGERQRLYLALFLVSGRDIMVMDECLSMVSLPQQIRIMKRIFAARPITCIWVDHRIQPELIALFDEIIFMDDDKKIHSGSSEEIGKLHSFSKLMTEKGGTDVE